MNAWVGAGNNGDELLFARLVSRLRALGVTEIVAPSLNPAATSAAHGVTAVSYRSVAATLRGLRRADLFILGPGGILQDDSSVWSLPYQSHRAALARVLRVDSIGVGLGVGPIRRRGSGWMLRGALGRVSPLIVRDEASVELAGSLGLRSALATADLVAGTDPPDVEAEDRVVVALRPHRPGGGRLPVRLQRDQIDDQNVAALASALDETSRRTGWKVHFVAFEPHRDQPLHEAVAHEMREPSTLCAPESNGLLAEMGRSRAVVATRFHAGIAALINRRPAVLLGYAGKVEALGADVGAGFEVLANAPEAYRSIPDAIDRVREVDLALIDAARIRMKLAEAANEELLARAIRAE